MAFRARTLFASQEGIVLVVTILLFAGFAVMLPAFASPGNLISLIRSIAILGVLSLGMSMAVIAKGVDVSMVATMVVSVAWVSGLVIAGLSSSKPVNFRYNPHREISPAHTAMHRKNCCEPGALKPSDDIHDASLIGGRTDQPAQI